MTDSTTAQAAAAPADPGQDWAAEYTTCERRLGSARVFVRTAAALGSISEALCSTYLEHIDTAQRHAVDRLGQDPANWLDADGPAPTSAEALTDGARAAAARAACEAVRDKAIELHHDHSICRGGLDAFLEIAELEPYVA